MSRIHPVTARPTSLSLKFRATLRNGHDLWNHVSLTELFGSNGNSFTVCTQSDMWVCIYTNVLNKIEKLVGQNK